MAVARDVKEGAHDTQQMHGAGAAAPLLCGARYEVRAALHLRPVNQIHVQ